MGANLVYLERPNTKKETIAGSYPGSQTTPSYKYASSAMQGWRLNMVSLLLLSFYHVLVNEWWCFDEPG